MDLGSQRIAAMQDLVFEVRELFASWRMLVDDLVEHKFQISDLE